MEKDKAIQILTDLKNELHKDDFVKLSVTENWNRDAYSRVENWKNNTCAILQGLFVSSFEEKKKEIEKLNLASESTGNIHNEDILAKRIRKQEEHLVYWRNQADKLISGYIESIIRDDLEENKITKKLTEQLETANQKIELLNKEAQKQKETYELKINQINEKHKNQTDEANQKIAKLTDEKVELEKKIPKTTWDKLKQNATGLTIIALVLAYLQYQYNVAKDIGATKYEKSKYDLEIKVESLTKQNNMFISEIQKCKDSFDSLKKLNTDKK